MKAGSPRRLARSNNQWSGGSASHGNASREGSPLVQPRPQFNIFQLAWELILVRCIVYYRALQLYCHYYFRLKPERYIVVLFCLPIITVEGSMSLNY